MLGFMPTAPASDSRLDQARALVRDKGLSSSELGLLDDILREGSGKLLLLTEPAPPRPAPEPPQLARLRRSFGLFLMFLTRLGDRRPGEARATAMVIRHGLAALGEAAAAAHREMLAGQDEPDWVVQLLALVTALRSMAAAPEPGGPEGPRLRDLWVAFLQDEKPLFQHLFAALEAGPKGPVLVAQLNIQMKHLNRTLQSGTGQPLAALRRLEVLLASALPEPARQRAEPLLLVQHVIASLRPDPAGLLDQGLDGSAVERVRASLQWLWDHLGWTLPAVEEPLAERTLTRDVRALLRRMRQERPAAFRIVARALAGHLALLNLMEGLEPAGSLPVQDRYAMVPVFRVIEAELGRLAERVFHPRVAASLPPGGEEARVLEGFLRQAVLGLLQDQATLRSLLQQALAQEDGDQLAVALDNLRGLVLNHQRRLMGDLVGLFAPDLRHRLFPDAPSPTEEGDRLRQRLYRLWQYLDPVLARVQVQLELPDWPRLALALAQVQAQAQAFRRSPEALLIRAQDRREFDRLAQQLARNLDAPGPIEPALTEAAGTAGEALRFLDEFLLRINARLPIIRLDQEAAREACGIARELAGPAPSAPDRNRLAHKLAQAARTLAIRDPQSLNLLRRWVRAERGGRDAQAPLAALAGHLEHLASRLDAALN
jgi:hypothetical protein